MGALDAVINEAGSRFGIGGSKVTTLLSSLFSFLNEQGGGLTGLVDRFRRTSVGDSVSSWLGVGTPSVSPDQVEAALGRDTVYNLAAKSGISAGTAAAALAFLIPRVIQRVSAGGVIPSQIPADLTSYMTGPTAAMAAGARQSDVFRRTCCGEGRIPATIPASAVRAGVVVDWTVAMGGRARAIRRLMLRAGASAGEASAALAALRPGFSANDLVGALNLEVINFQTASANPIGGL
jgi:uncharacterized protein YidB (DUF937 family)